MYQAARVRRVQAHGAGTGFDKPSPLFVHMRSIEERAGVSEAGCFGAGRTVCALAGASPGDLA